MYSYSNCCLPLWNGALRFSRCREWSVSKKFYLWLCGHNAFQRGFFFNHICQELHKYSQSSLLASLPALFPVILLPFHSYFSSIVFSSPILPISIEKCFWPLPMALYPGCTAVWDWWLPVRLPVHRWELGNQFGFQPTDFFCSCNMLCHQWQGLAINT